MKTDRNRDWGGGVSHRTRGNPTGGLPAASMARGAPTRVNKLF